MGIVTIPSGVSTTSNTSNVDFDLVGIANDANVNTFKTLINGQWHSWLKGTPDAYQGFNNLKRGYGYVVKTNGILNIDFGNTTLDVNNVVLSPGMMLLGIPFNGKQITASGNLPRFSATSIKTIEGTWKSWSRGVPSNFQGFSSINSNNGYVINIDKVFDNYLYKNQKNRNTGVKIGAIETISNNVNNNEIYNLPNNYDIKSVSSTATVSPNPTLKTMVLDIGGDVQTIKFPVELTGSDITIVKNNTVVVNLGSVTDTVGVVYNSGSVTEQITESDNYGSIDTVNAVFTEEYTYTLTENVNVNAPVTTSVFINEDILEIMYDSKTFNSNQPMKVMNLNINGNLTRLSFANEYTGDSFTVMLGDTSYQGTFTESSSYVTL